METRNLESVRFDILTDSDVAALGVVEVSSKALKVQFDREGNLHDLRMGAFKNLPCKTCGHHSTNCTGHFGFINLARPIINPLMVYNSSKILRLALKSLCGRCWLMIASARRNKRKVIFENKGRQGKRAKKNSTVAAAPGPPAPAPPGPAMTKRKRGDSDDEYDYADNDHGHDNDNDHHEDNDNDDNENENDNDEHYAGDYGADDNNEDDDEADESGDEDDDDQEDIPLSETQDIRTCCCPSGLSELKFVRRKYNSNQSGGLTFQILRDGDDLPIHELYAGIASICKATSDQILTVARSKNAAVGNSVDAPSAPSTAHISSIIFQRKMLVIPIVVRPPNLVNGRWHPSRLSILYSQIIQANSDLRMMLVHRERGQLATECHNKLQNAVCVLFDINNTKATMSAQLTDAGSLRQRLEGKKGRVRGNLMGKRVNFSARTVLSGDPNLGLNEVGIPRSVANNLTVPMMVANFNIDSIDMSTVRYVVRPTGPNTEPMRIDVERNDAFTKEDLQVGDTVERKLRNGDLVVCNRQPSLHRGSMVGCRARIFDTSTFSLNYSTMLSLAADADGDEINVHVPQDLTSVAEIEELLLTSKTIVSSQASKPLIGMTQDSLLGAYLLSCSGRTLHGAIATELLYKVIGYAFDIDKLVGEAAYDGHDLISCLFRHLDIKVPRSNEGNSAWDVIIDDEDRVTFKRDPKPALLNKKLLGVERDSLFHRVYIVYGHLKSAKLMEAMQRLAIAYLDHRGFSMSISDCFFDDGDMNARFDELDKTLWDDYMKRRGVDEEGLMRQLGKVLLQPARASKASAGFSTSIEEDTGLNRLEAMVFAGSKGGVINVNQIGRFVGQQNDAEGGRIHARMRHGTRVLPHFPSGDPSLEARGFVKNSFLKGLSPAEFFQHTMAARVGLIDTACKTATTGYTQRCLVKNLERAVTESDGSVRDVVTGRIVQFKYGHDGMDATEQM